MAKLTSGQRNALPSNDFVFPAARKYPVNNPSHARDALSRAGAQGGAVQAKVRAKVKAKFPKIGKFGHPSMNNHKMAGYSAAAASVKTPAHLRPHQAKLAGIAPQPSPLEDPMEDTAMAHIRDQQVVMDSRKKARIKTPPAPTGGIYGM
jgi:hypothetical protein